MTEQETRALDEENFVRVVTDTYEGRALLSSLIDESGRNRSSFAGERGATDFNEGMRNMGLRILEKVFTFAPDAYTIMHTEEQDRQRRYAAIEGDEEL